MTALDWLYLVNFSRASFRILSHQLNSFALRIITTFAYRQTRGVSGKKWGIMMRVSQTTQAAHNLRPQAHQRPVTFYADTNTSASNRNECHDLNCVNRHTLLSKFSWRLKRDIFLGLKIWIHRWEQYEKEKVFNLCLAYFVSENQQRAQRINVFDDPK